MADSAAVLIQIRGDVADINAKLTDIKGHIGKVTDETKKMAASSKTSWAMISAGIAATIYNLRELIQQASYFTNEYMKQETAVMKMGVAMKNQGDYTRAALKDMEAFAEAMQETTSYADDQVLSFMANLKTYGMTNDEVKKATKTILDFAAAKRTEGMTVESASELIGKAYVGETGMLKRYGIVIDQNIPKTEKYAAVMAQLNQRFGGAAQADLETYAGQLAKIKNQLGDIAEVIGLGVLKAVQALQFGFSMLSVGFWTAVEKIMQGVTWLSEKLGAFAESLGLTGVASKIGAFSSHMKGTVQIYAEIKEEALHMANANYTAMTSFDNVGKALDGMASGTRTKGIAEVDKALQKLAERWGFVREKLLSEMTTGRTPIEENLERITVEAKKLSKEFEKVPGALALIGQWEKARKGTILEENRRSASSAEAAWDQQTQEKITENHRAEWGNRVAISQDAWDKMAYYERLTGEKITQEQIDDVDLLTDAYLSSYQGAFRKVWLELEDSIHHMEYLARETATAMQHEFSDLFFDVITGKTKTFADYFKSVLQAVARAVANNLAQSTTHGIGEFLKGVMSFVGGRGGYGGSSTTDTYGVDAAGSGEFDTWHRGGVVGADRAAYRIVPKSIFANAPRYHSGIGPDERPAILQRGEGVFTAGQMAALGQKNYNITILAVDSKSFEDMVNRNPGAIVTVVGQALKDNTSLRYLMKDTVR